jgi:two-component system OmpR family response regulator
MSEQVRRIYILEDDKDVSAVFARALTGYGYQVQSFSEVRSFARQVEEAAPDLAVVDLGLPDGDGLSVLRGNLTRFGVATIIVTGRGGLADKLKGLDYGADDYLVKPVEPLELVARVRTVLRRVSGSTLKTAGADQATVAKFAGWRVDFDTLQLTSPDHDTATLTRSDARLLRAFIDAQGRVLTREFLLDFCEIGAEENFDRAIDVRVSRLRKKLKDDSRSPTHIRTVYGAGYVFASPATWL